MFKGHPKALPMLFMTEMWERFSFYSLRALLVLYMIGNVSSGGLEFTKAFALKIFGIYMGVAYITPLLGGYLADHYLGQRRSVVVGGSLMALGHFLMAFNNVTLFYTALGFIALGNGFFKPCLTSILGSMYKPGDTHRDGGFSLFYMGINIGGLLGPFIAGWLQTQYGFDYGFAAAGFGMLLGLIIFQTQQKKYLGDIGLKPQKKIHVTPEDDSKLTSLEKNRIAAIFILNFFIIAFWCAFEQEGGLFVIFAEEQTNRMIGNFEIPTAWLFTLNPIFIITLAPVLSYVWNWLAEGKRDPSFAVKVALGFFFTGAAFVMMMLVSKVQQMDASTKAHVHWFVWFNVLLTLGELCISPVSWSAVSKLAPKKYLSFLMAVALSSIGFGFYLSGYVGSMIEDFTFYEILSSVSIVMFVLGTTLLILSPKLMRMVGMEKKKAELQTQS